MPFCQRPPWGKETLSEQAVWTAYIGSRWIDKFPRRRQCMLWNDSRCGYLWLVRLVLCIDLDSVGCGICDSCRWSTSFHVSASLSLRADETEEHTGSIINGESHLTFACQWLVFKCRLSFCHQTKAYGWLSSPLVTLDTLPSSSSLHRWHLCIILTCTRTCRACVPSTSYVPNMGHTR